jgi:hypothetical protein
MPLRKRFESQFFSNHLGLTSAKGGQMWGTIPVAAQQITKLPTYQIAKFLPSRRQSFHFEHNKH